MARMPTLLELAQMDRRGTERGAMRAFTNAMMAPPGPGRAAQPAAPAPQPARAPAAAPMPAQAPAPAPERRGLLGGFFGPEGRDARARLAIGLEGMTLNPNEALIGQLQQGIESRETAAQKNATVEWLKSRGRDDLAAAMEGGLPAADALRIAMEPAAGPERGVVVGGNVVNPLTGEIIYQGPEKAAEMSATERDIALLGELGIPRDEAIRITQLYVISRDPVTGEQVLINKATGQAVGGLPQQTMGQPSPAPAPTAATDEFGQPFPEAPTAFGLEGAARNVANIAGDVTGLGTPFPQTQQSMADFRVLQETLINDIAAAYDRQPPSWLLQNIRDLTPQPGSVFTGPDAAAAQLDALGRNLANELRNTEAQLNERLSPADREVLRKRRVGLNAGLDRIRNARNALVPQAGPVTLSPEVEDRLRAYE